MIGRKSMTDQDLRVLYDLSNYNCVRFGAYTEVIFEDQHLVRKYTNIEIAKEATQLAYGLRKLGIEKGDRVIVMMPNSPEVIISYQAIARVGAVIIPVLPLLKGPEVRFIAENSGARAILTSALLLPILQSALNELPSMQFVISTHITEEQAQANHSSPQLLAYSDLVAKEADQADHYLEDMEGVIPSPDDMSVIIYSHCTAGCP